MNKIQATACYSSFFLWKTMVLFLTVLTVLSAWHRALAGKFSRAGELVGKGDALCLTCQNCGRSSSPKGGLPVPWSLVKPREASWSLWSFHVISNHWNLIFSTTWRMSLSERPLRPDSEKTPGWKNLRAENADLVDISSSLSWSPRDLETKTADLETITADLETMIWKLWFGNYNSGFGNWEQRIWKLWFGNYEVWFGNWEPRIWKLWLRN